MVNNESILSTERRPPEDDRQVISAIFERYIGFKLTINYLACSIFYKVGEFFHLQITSIGTFLHTAFTRVYYKLLRLHYIPYTIIYEELSLKPILQLLLNQNQRITKDAIIMLNIFTGIIASFLWMSFMVS